MGITPGLDRRLTNKRHNQSTSKTCIAPSTPRRIPLTRECTIHRGARKATINEEPDRGETGGRNGFSGIVRKIAVL